MWYKPNYLNLLRKQLLTGSCWCNAGVKRAGYVTYAFIHKYSLNKCAAYYFNCNESPLYWEVLMLFLLLAFLLGPALVSDAILNYKLICHRYIWWWLSSLLLLLNSVTFLSFIIMPLSPYLISVWGHISEHICLLRASLVMHNPPTQWSAAFTDSGLSVFSYCSRGQNAVCIGPADSDLPQKASSERFRAIRFMWAAAELPNSPC